MRWFFIKWIAHRGIYKGKTKENSILAFQNAIRDERFSGFELDIRTSKDGVFMVHHNIFIEGYLFSSLTSRELQDKFSIPTLESVLKLKTDKVILIEIKEPNIDVTAFKKLIRQFEDKNIYIDSFDNKIIKKLRQEKVKAKLGVLNYVINSENDYQDYDFIGLLSPIVTESLLTYFKERNMEVFLYGIKNLDDVLKREDIYYIVDEK